MCLIKRTDILVLKYGITSFERDLFDVLLIIRLSSEIVKDQDMEFSPAFHRIVNTLFVPHTQPIPKHTLSTHFLNGFIAFKKHTPDPVPLYKDLNIC